jgi:hypothetical protein
MLNYWEKVSDIGKLLCLSLGLLLSLSGCTQRGFSVTSNESNRESTELPSPEAPSPTPNPTLTPAPTTAPTPAPVGIKKSVSVIVAQGTFGRTTISFDDGKTWIANRSFDLEGSDMVCGDKTPVICGVTSCQKKAVGGGCYVQTPCECGHEQGMPKGIVVAQNSIVTNFGWGNPGVTMRSVDGVNWTSVHYHTDNYNGFAYGVGRFIHWSTLDTLVSDDGINWLIGPRGYTQELTPRGFKFLDYGTGRFVGVADGNLIRVSADKGLTWVTATAPAGCASGQILTGNGIAVMIWDDGKACRSADGGMTWTLHNINSVNQLAGGGVFANGKFMVWGLPNSFNGDGARYSSSDGITWAATPTNGTVTVGALGVTPEGTLVGTAWFWSDYANQVFIRSTDNGLTWTTADSYVKSHMISTFASGKIEIP